MLVLLVFIPLHLDYLVHVSLTQLLPDTFPMFLWKTLIPVAYLGRALQIRKLRHKEVN